MKCPFCKHLEDKVIDSRPTEDGEAIRRRRECLNCNIRFTTYEKVEMAPLMVVKSDGKRQPFDQEKLVRGILRSCVKRPVAVEKIEEMAFQVEMYARNQLMREIKTSEIGELVMKYLKKIDEVAYIRFSSVYRQFDNIESFFREIVDLKEDRGKEHNE